MNLNLKINIIRKESIFHGLRPDWSDLLNECQLNNIFLTWEWLYTWWKVYGEGNRKLKLFLIELRDKNGKLIGIGPMMLKKNKLLNTLELIGTGEDVTSEYLEIIKRKRYESIVNKRLEKLIYQIKGLDVVSLKSLQPMDIEGWNLLRGKHKIISEFSRCPVFELPNNWKKFLENQSANFRKKAKEYYRVCRRDLKLRLVQVESKEELNKWIAELARLHHLRWNGNSRAFYSEKYIKFHSEIAQKFLDNGWLKLFFLLDGDRPIAALYCFFYNGVYYYYQSGRDPAYKKYHVGFVLINLVIQEAIGENAKEFDMLTGVERYKYRWAKRDNICFHLLGFKNRSSYLCYHLECLLDKFIYFLNYYKPYPNQNFNRYQ